MAYINKMRGQDYIDKTRDYLDYLEEHLNNVMRAFNEICSACNGMAWFGDDYTWFNFRTEVENHDLSKFSAKEFTQYRSCFFPLAGESVDKELFYKSWDHHKQENRHHHEVAKTTTDIVHMIIEWTAMGYKFGGTAQQYYEENETNIKLNSNLKEFMYEIFNKIHEKA